MPHPTCLPGNSHRMMPHRRRGMTMWLKHHLLLLTALTLSCNAEAADFRCQLTAELHVSPSNLQTQVFAPRETHRISGDSLFINDPTRPGEYLYGKLVEVEFGRYTVGHKTYIFTDQARSQGIVAHVDGH